MLARIAFDVAQALDTVTLHQPHGAGIEIGPYRFGAELLLGLQQALGDLVKRVVPRQWAERLAAAPLLAGPA